MNAEQLQVIKDRVEKATPGPWYTENDSLVRSHEDEMVVAEMWRVANGANDAQFITHAREDILALIGEVERLQNIIISERRESLINTYESIGAEDVEIKRLREALGFYADEKNYNRVTLSILTAKVLLDNGELARQALEVTK